MINKIYESILVIPVVLLLVAAWFYVAITSLIPIWNIKRWPKHIKLQWKNLVKKPLNW